MKKIIAIAALACAAMGMNAEVYTYDFHTNPSFFEYLQADPADPEFPGMGQAKNYDFIDKYGIPMVPGSKGELLQAKNEEGQWVATDPRCRISLSDGYAYYLGADGKWTSEGEELDMTEPFIGYGDKGPSRIIWMYNWGTLDAWADEDYNAIDEANWVATKHAMGFLRNGNSGIRQDSYVQFPEVNGAAEVTVWAGHAGSKNSKSLRVKIQPVVDGVEQTPFYYYIPLEETVAKRYYKLTINNLDKRTGEDGARLYGDPYTGAGNVAYRIGDAGEEVHIYHVEIKTGADSGLENIIAAPEDENAPIYNIMGQRVGADYKGLVIKNGVKYIQK